MIAPPDSASGPSPSAIPTTAGLGATGEYRLLFIGDSDEQLATVLRALQNAGHRPNPQRVTTGVALRAALGQQAWDAVIAVDPTAALSPLDTLAVLKEHELDLPFIVLAEEANVERAVAAIKAGAHDYLSNDDLSRLGASLERELYSARVRQRYRRAERARARFITVLETATDFVAILTVDSKVLHINRAGRLLLGISPDESVFHLQLGELYPAWARDRLLSQALPRAIRDGSWTGDMAMVRRDGQEIPVSQVLVAHKAASGEVEFLSTFARDISERKQAEDRIRREAARAKALVRVAARLNAQLELETVLDAVAEEATRALDVAKAGVCLCDDLDSPLGGATPAEPLLESNHLPLLLRRVLIARYHQQPKELIVLPDVSTPPVPTELTRLAAQGVCTVVGASLRREDQLVGFLYIVTSGEARHFTDDDLALLKALADQAVQAITNARLFKEARQRATYLEALHAIVMASSASLDLRVTFNTVLDQVVAQLRVDAATILLFNEATQLLEYIGGRGFRSTDIQRVRLRLGDDYAGQAALDRRLLSIADLREPGPTRSRSHLLAREGLRSGYVVPLIAKGHLKGVLELFHRSPLVVDVEWLNVLESLAQQIAIALDNATLFEGLQRSNADLRLAYDATIEGWSRALDLRDEETEGHTLRVTEMTLRLAHALGIGEAELIHIRRGALLHDIGKMGIPDGILLKPGPLTEEEWVMMRRHPVYAYEMLSPITFLRPALDIPYCHHERWDGTGYPRGLRGEQIPLAARVFAVVDTWDALRFDRPYRQGWPADRVLAHIQSLAGTSFDPKIVVALEEWLEHEGDQIE